MSKIIRAINVIISNQKKISDVISGKNENELFFLYDNKHKWSVRKSQDDENFFVFYYRGKRGLNDYAQIPEEDWEGISREFITYSTKELKSREALESMQELYRIVKEKLLGMDDVLDEIIKNDESAPPF